MQFFGLILVLALSSNAMAFSGLSALEHEQMSQEEFVIATLHLASGRKLSGGEVDGIKKGVRKAEIVKSQPQKAGFDILGRERHQITALICIGAVGGMIGKFQITVCSDLLGNVYYMHGVGAVGFGGAIEAYTFLVNHRKTHPIEPRFTYIGQSGLAWADSLGKIFPGFGTKLGLFHSVLGSQGGAILGVQIGKYIEVGATQILLNDSFEDLVSDIENRQDVFLSEEERQKRREKRIQRFEELKSEGQ